MPTIEKPLILVAEDDTITRMKLVRFLERELKATVLSAQNGDDAWKVYEENSEIQFVISDWVMPGGTGVDLVEKIRAAENRRYTYFILLSGRNEREDLLTGMQAGADEYLIKPFDPAELNLRVRAGLRIIGLEQELAAQNDKLNAALGSLEEAVQAATKVQQHLLPSTAYIADLASRTSLELSYMFQVCESLGGDIIGVFEPADGLVAVFLADVTGHGIAASMAAVSLNSFIRTYLRSSYAPLDLITQAHRFCNDEFPEGMYATMVYMLIEPGKHRLSVVVAGHPPLLKLNANGQISEHSSTMPPLGMWDDTPGPEVVVEMSFEHGDRLVAYTDGVIETRNSAGIFFAKEWLNSSIVRAALSEETSVPQRIAADLDAWRGSVLAAEDDITILALRFV
ncbi:MAG: SpoIIE family protein phosphatase [bacterium]|nr:SpoIIE family protein phosphatase [bacterium]